MKRTRVLVLLHPEQAPPDSIKGYSEQDILAFKTGYDVVNTLRKARHEVRVLGVQHELRPIRNEIDNFKPDIVFNLLEEFHGEPAYDQNVASYLELIRIPFTGCNPRGLMLSRGKDLSKKLLAYHRIPVPAFAVFPMNRKIKRPDRLKFPLIVKTLSEDASLGIAQKSIVDSDEKLVERVTFVHEKLGVAAIAEQYIAGRELYVSVMGNERLRMFPVWELEFGDATSRIATAKVKFDVKYQEQRGILQGPAEDLAPELHKRIRNLTRRICRTLELDGYARIDFRLSPEGIPYFLEANPNPEIARYEVFAEAAAYDGMKYSEMLRRIIALGLQRARRKG
jgi:D-alanine-D-alanine ligase